MRQHQGHVRWRDAADPAGLSEGDGADSGELLAGLEAKVLDLEVIEGHWNPLVLQPLLAFHLLLLPLDVAGIFQVVSNLQGCFARNGP